MSDIAKATIIIIIFTFLSKILGFGRDMALAYVFGISTDVDAYLVAYTVPNLLFAVIGSALSLVVIPIYNEYIIKGQKIEANLSLSRIFTLVTLIMTIILILGLVFSKELMYLLAPGLSEGSLNLASELNIIMISSIIFLGITKVFGGLLNANGIFGPPALNGVINNLFIIIFIFGGIWWGIEAVALGTFVGVVVALLVQLPYHKAIKFKYSPSLTLQDPGVKECLAQMVPIMVGVGITQLYLITDRLFASGLEMGSISAINYASKIVFLPEGIFVMAVSTAIFPKISRKYLENRMEDMVIILAKGFRLINFLALPASVGLIILSRPIVELIFQRGAFDAKATEMTSVALVCFSIGLLGLCLNPIITRGFYALKDTKTPMYVGGISLFINVILSMFLLEKMDHAGLALANSISVMVNVIVMFYIFSIRAKTFSSLILNKQLIRQLLVTLAMAVAVLATDKIYTAVLSEDHLLIRLPFNIFIGLLTYFLGSYLVKIPECLYILEQANKIYCKLSAKYLRKNITIHN